MPSASVPPPAAEVLSAETKHDPDLWLRALSWAVVIFSVAQVLVFSFGRDQSIYGLVAEGLLEGAVPYRDRWDFKPPGIFFVYAAAFAAFGKTMLAPRLVEALLLIGTVLGLRRLGGVFFGSRTAGIMAGAVYALVHAQMDFWHTGQPESFAGALTIYGLVLTTHPWPRKREAYAWIAIGLLFGAAFVLKPPFGGGAVACAWYLSSGRRSDGRSLLTSLSPFIWIGFASLAPIALCGLWFKVHGGWPALSWTLFEFAPGYTALGWVRRSAEALFFRSMSEGFFGLSSLLALGTVAAAAIHPRAEREREGLLLLLGLLAFQFIGITVQAKFFQYHFGASIPLIALIAGQGYYKLWRRLGPGSSSGTLAFAAFLIVAATMKLPVNDTPGGGFWHRSVTRLEYLLSAGHSMNRQELDEELHYVGGYNLAIARSTAQEVRRLTQEGDSIYVWGFEPAIYSLSGRRPSSSYIYNVPQRAQWQSERAWRKLYRDLEKHPPAAVVTQRRDAMHFVTGTRLDSTDSLELFPRFQRWLEDGYAPEQQVDRFMIWLPKKLKNEPQLAN